MEIREKFLQVFKQEHQTILDRLLELRASGIVASSGAVASRILAVGENE